MAVKKYDWIEEPSKIYQTQMPSQGREPTVNLQSDSSNGRYNEALL